MFHLSQKRNSVANLAIITISKERDAGIDSTIVPLKTIHKLCLLKLGKIVNKGKASFKGLSSHQRSAQNLS